MVAFSQRVPTGPAYLLQLWRGIEFESSDLSIVVVLVQLLLDQSVARLRTNGMIAANLVKFWLLWLREHDFVLFGRFASFVESGRAGNNLLDRCWHHASRLRQVHHFLQGSHDLLLIGTAG